jgi:hypothetical protein
VRSSLRIRHQVCSTHTQTHTYTHTHTHTHTQTVHCIATVRNIRMAFHSTVMYCAVLHCTTLRCTALHCTTLHCVALYCTAQHSLLYLKYHLISSFSHSIISHCTSLDYITPSHHIALPHTALHCTALHSLTDGCCTESYTTAAKSSSLGASQRQASREA